MFYKPKFCCNCGEKIERIDWRLWTSRRFCSVCEIEQKGHELLPKVLIGVAVLFGIFGIGSFLQKPAAGGEVIGESAPVDIRSKRTVALEPRTLAPAESRTQGPGMERSSIEELRDPDVLPPVPTASKEQPRLRKIASDEPIYYCRAMTKKGKPCSRRVKSNERCWQHAGQPSAVPAPEDSDIY